MRGGKADVVALALGMACDKDEVCNGWSGVVVIVQV